MKKTSETLLLPALLTAALLLGACRAPTAPESGEAPAGTSAPPAAAESLFSDRDLSGQWETEGAVDIDLSAGGGELPGVDWAKGVVTIREAGVYVLSGALDGQVVVDAGGGDKVQLVLAGVRIASADSAAVLVRSADKVFITLAKDSRNTLENGGVYTDTDDGKIDAVLFSKADLTLNGDGDVTINAPAGHGIVCKDALVLAGGTYTVTAERHGVEANDSIAVAGGSFSVTAGKDGFQAEGGGGAAPGLLYIAGGRFALDTGDDAFSAVSVAIMGGEFALNCGGDGIKAQENVTIDGGSFLIPACREGIEGQSVTIEGGRFDIRSADDGINAAGDGGRIVINGGRFTVVSDGDCLDSNGDIILNGGDLHLTCNGNGNTALDASGSYTNNGGSVTTNDGSHTAG